jgi:hypothetical protein
VAENYLDRDTLKLRMPDTDWGTKYDPVFDMVVEGASRDIDEFLGREAGSFAAPVATARTFTGSGTLELWVPEMAEAPIEVAVAESGDLTNYTIWSATDYHLWPYNAGDKGEPYTKLEIDQINGTKYLWYSYPKSVRITARWGYSLEPPATVVKACIIQAIRAFKRAQQSYQDTGAVIELRQLQYVKGLDPEVEAFLAGSGLKELTV